MATEGYLVSPKLLQQIQNTVRHYLNLYGGGGTHGYSSQGQIHRQVILAGDLLAAVDTLTDPSFAQAVVLRRKDNGDLETTAEQITIVNRFENISVDADTYAKAEWIDGEWQLYAADCPAGSVGSMMSSGGGGASSGATPPGESI
jgi:hypothetical protein